MYLLFWPSSSTPSTSTSSSTLSTKGGDTRNVLSKWMELSVSVNREGINTSPSRHAAQTDDSTYYLIFDAIQHKGSLKFLDRLSTKWKIIVVNSAESCKRCEIGGKTLIQMFLASDESSSTWEHVPRYMREKMAAISYALSHSADWLYVTDSQFLPEEDTLLSVCSHKVITVYQSCSQCEPEVVPHLIVSFPALFSHLFLFLWSLPKRLSSHSLEKKK